VSGLLPNVLATPRRYYSFDARNNCDCHRNNTFNMYERVGGLMPVMILHFLVNVLGMIITA
jgi:hypothetical protein